MEEDDADAVLFADGGKVLLGAVEIPERGEDAAVLIGVGVTDHHLLGESVGDAGITTSLERALGHRMRQERIHDASAALEVTDGLKKRDDGQEAVSVFGAAGGEAGLAGEKVDGQ